VEQGPPPVHEGGGSCEEDNNLEFLGADGSDDDGDDDPGDDDGSELDFVMLDGASDDE
jgi:hypothetical protein